MAFRVDALGAFGSVKKTPSGGIEFPAYLTRTGVFEYRTPSGRVVRELRHPDDVFAPDSLRTLRHAAVTVLHPKEREVTVDNWKDVSVGHMAEVEPAGGRFVKGHVIAQEPQAVKDVLESRLVEISCGYRCDHDETPGTFNGEPYDRRQKNIRYNHVALGPSNWGRAGRECRIRLDDSYIALMDADTAVSEIRIDDAAAPVAAPPAQVLDAKDFVSKSEFDAIKAERDALKTQVTELTTRCDSLSASATPAALDKLVAERTKLVADAKTIAPELKADGLDALAIMKAALAVADPSLKLDSESADYVRASFGFHVKSRAAVVASHAGMQHVTAPAGSAVTDSSDEDPIIKAQKANTAAYGKKA